MITQLRLSRQADMIPPLDGVSAAIIGMGGIGSNAAHLMASMGFSNVHLFDNDEIGEENLYPGFFSQMDIGEPKSVGVSNDIWYRYGVRFTSYDDLFQNVVEPDWEWDVVLICTDSLISRQEIWETNAKYICGHVYIDARMGGTLATVYAVEMADPNALVEYNAELGDGRFSELPCGEKATAPLTKGFISGMIGQVLFDVANNRTPPFMQRYDLTHHLYLAQGEAPKLEMQDEPATV
jgi:hypothetical protein